MSAESLLLKHQLLILTRDRQRAPELVAALVEIERRNPRWGCPRIAQQIALSFGLTLDKDVVRRVLARQFRPPSVGGLPGKGWRAPAAHDRLPASPRAGGRGL